MSYIVSIINPSSGATYIWWDNFREHADTANPIYDELDEMLIPYNDQLDEMLRPYNCKNGDGVYIEFKTEQDFLLFVLTFGLYTKYRMSNISGKIVLAILVLYFTLEIINLVWRCCF